MVQGTSHKEHSDFTEYDPSIPSTSSCPISKTSDVCNTTINIPVANLPSTSMSTDINQLSNTSIGGITMTCHNCTINYNFN